MATWRTWRGLPPKPGERLCCIGLSRTKLATAVPRLSSLRSGVLECSQELPSPAREGARHNHESTHSQHVPKISGWLRPLRNGLPDVQPCEHAKDQPRSDKILFHDIQRGPLDGLRRSENAPSLRSPQSGVGATLPPSPGFGRAGCHRTPKGRRASTLQGIPKISQVSGQSPFVHG